MAAGLCVRGGGGHKRMDKAGPFEIRGLVLLKRII